MTLAIAGPVRTSREGAYFSKRLSSIVEASMVLYLLLGAGTQGLSASEFDSWKLQTELGYSRPEGRIDDVFGGGVDVSFTVGRRLFSPLIAEAGFRWGDMTYPSGQTISVHGCIRTRPAGFICLSGPTKQRGTFTGLTLGLSLPVIGEGRGRGLQVAAGGVISRYSVSPGGESLGSRRGSGFYLALAIDLLPVGSSGSAGLVVRGTRLNTHGGNLETSLPPESGDTWLEVNVALRLGPGKSKPRGDPHPPVRPGDRP